MALYRRVGLHGLHTQPVRDLHRPVLSHHRAYEIPDSDDRRERLHFDHCRVGVVRLDLFPLYPLVEGRRGEKD